MTDVPEDPPEVPNQKAAIVPVYQALAAASRDVGAVGKNQRNTQQGYAFRGIDDLMNAANPALTRHGVVILPYVEDIEYVERPTSKGGVMTTCRLQVRYDIHGPAGDWISTRVVSEGSDVADKSTSKALAMALKYALLQVLMIPTDDMDDGDRTTPDTPAPTIEALWDRLDAAAKGLGIDRDTAMQKVMARYGWDDYADVTPEALTEQIAALRAYKGDR